MAVEFRSRWSAWEPKAERKQDRPDNGVPKVTEAHYVTSGSPYPERSEESTRPSGTSVTEHRGHLRGAATEKISQEYPGTPVTKVTEG